MTTPRFDESKDHGQIIPPDNGAHFYQNGHYFSVRGEYLRSDAGIKGAVKSAPSDPIKVEVIPVNESEPVDLAAWAKKEKNYPFFTVRSAAEAAYPEADTSNTKAILALLIAEGVITAEEAIR
jgi:hypothetical protein